MKALMSVKGLKIAYGKEEIVKQVSFDIHHDEIVSIVGESGSGKTTLIRAIMGILPASGQIRAGDILYRGQSIGQDKKAMTTLRGKEIGMIFQNPSSYMNPILKVSAQFVESIRSHQNLSVDEAKKLAINYLKAVSLDEPERIMDAYMHELSGGMQQRVYIAMVMANKPKLLLADEPSSALDVVVGRAIADELIQVKKTSAASMLIVTHDIALAAYMSDRLIVMKDGAIVEMGKTEDVVNSPNHDYTKELMHTVPRQEL